MTSLAPATGSCSAGGGLERPLVSVVMPVYNGSRFLDATLLAVASQTYSRMECIAADDGSTDSSQEILHRQGTWRLVRVSRLGSNGARRAALAKATGTYVAFLDQDDLWHPTHLAACIAVLESCPDAPAAVGRRSRFIDGRRPILVNRGGACTRYDPWSSFPFTMIDSPSMVLVRRTALDRIGGWPEEGGSAADCLAWWRLGTLGDFGVTRATTVGIREVAGSMSDLDRKARRRCFDNIVRTAIIATDSLDAARRPSLRRRAESVGETLGCVIDALENGCRIDQSAIAWERAVANRSDAMVLLAARFLGWLFQTDPRSSVAAERRRLVDTVLGHWPAAAPRTGREMRRWIAVAFSPALIAASLRSSPTRIAAWRCLAECLGAHIARRAGWNADPLALDLHRHLPVVHEARS